MTDSNKKDSQNKFSIISEIYKIIRERKINPPEKSYVSGLIKEGIEKIAAKIREESEEFIEASGSDDTAHTVHEAADLLFHSLVLLGYKDIDPELVMDELIRRFGTSGITEKESRGKK